VQHYLDNYGGLVSYIANDYSKRYKMLDIDDIKQELWVWFITHTNKLNEWETNHSDKDRNKLINRSLRNAAQKYCTREKAKVVGYEVQDLFYYEPQIIEEFLPYILTDSYFIPLGINDVNYKPDRNVVAEGNTWLAVRADISQAYEAIDERHQNVLRLRFGSLSTSLEDVGNELKISADAARKRVDRAMKALIDELGGPRPFVDNDYRKPDSGEKTT
jgi:RNA polymerase sigma factor (sigma-70 family)